MFNKDLTPMYQGRVLMNDTALNDPALIAVLDEMALRDFKDRPQPNEGTWYISDRHQTYQGGDRFGYHVRPDPLGIVKARVITEVDL